MSTWNSADKSAQITLSGGDLIATNASASGTFSGVRSTDSHTTGKWYFELTLGSGNTNAMVGFGTSGVVLTASFPGGNADGQGYYQADGNKWTGGSGTAYGATYAAGDVIGVAIDLDGDTCNFYKNGADQGSISISGIAGAVFACVSIYAAPASITANFGASAWAGSLPSGYTAWDGSGGGGGSAIGAAAHYFQSLGG